MAERIHLEQHVLQGNKLIAGQNRDRFQRHHVLAVNVLSSPGAGKTTLLERLAEQLKTKLRMAVIEGDIATTLDSERIAAHGVQAVQINTHGACHLDARMVMQALEYVELADIDLLIIENVGNLVCPAEFDLGEELDIVVLSATEGEDKVAKYPFVFKKADAVILNKTDLLPYIPFDVERFEAEVRLLNVAAPIFQVSALKRDGLDEWIGWLCGKLEAADPQ
ncbi:hydrogenase nickel incorporation protein HypB [Paenibacillus thalictri]|uniref:Hydrogenase accessory protein HypB n=1 Tax=Paenibacillus thalictri TaxID=2527873 RepID=A0A4Q9DTN0_9BACL|nr:hydrogenase nickel incorporation protein HypB [Paenibacillus thalictri]TBL80303.1 hydrogenase accessory protein HypB [Paenibacillus thalictri]